MIEYKVTKTYPLKGQFCVEVRDYDARKAIKDEKSMQIILTHEPEGTVDGTMILTPDQLDRPLVISGPFPSKLKRPEKTQYFLYAYPWHPDDPNQLSLGI